MALTRKRKVCIAFESTPLVDPSADGSGYVYVPALSVGDLSDDTSPIAGSIATGTNWETQPIAPLDSPWSFPLDVPLSGLASAAGDGTAASSVAVDYLDILLGHILSAAASVAGEGLGSGSTTSSLVLDTDPTGYDAQQLVPVFESGLPTAGERTQWTMLNVSAGATFAGCTPVFDDAPTTAAVAYGTKTFLPTDTGGATIALTYQQDDVTYTLLGGRVTACSLIGELDNKWMARLTIAGCTHAKDTGKSALPAAVKMSRWLKVGLSPFWFDGSKYATRKIEIDLGISAAKVGATSAASGYVDHRSISLAPRYMIEPLFSDDLNLLKRSQAVGRAMVQLGGGVLSGGVLNTMAVHSEEVSVRDTKRSDDAGQQRMSVTFGASTPVLHSSGDAARVFQIARA